MKIKSLLLKKGCGIIFSFFFASDGTVERRKQQRSQSVTEQSSALYIYHKMQSCAAQDKRASPVYRSFHLVVKWPYLGCSHMLLSAPSHPRCNLWETMGSKLITIIWYWYKDRDAGSHSDLVDCQKHHIQGSSAKVKYFWIQYFATRRPQ